MITSRLLHRWFGLTSAGFGLVLAVTGAFLALEPMTEGLRTGSLTPAADVDVATLAEAIVTQIEGVERIEKTANHTVWAYYSDAEGFGKVAFDPATLAPVYAPAPSSVWSFIKGLHRSFFLGDVGRAMTGAVAFAMLALALTGLTMLVRRMGGWRALLFPPTHGMAQRLHLAMGRVAVIGLLVVSLTGVAMSLVTFNVVPMETGPYPAFPAVDASQSALAIGDLAALQNTPLAAFRELVLPYPNDPGDVYQLTTHTGSGFVDPTTGTLSELVAHGQATKIYEMIYLLHTGQGAWVIGVILGLSMLAVPFVIVTGVIMALRRPATRKPSRSCAQMHDADTILLVGSEGATTWGFATELSNKLTAAGQRVHIADMNDLRTDYAAAKSLFILTATYGLGEAPANAAKFVAKLRYLDAANIRYAVLGFGDRSFPRFCQFATDVNNACVDTGMANLFEYTTIDRQSSQAFASWGHQVGHALGITLDLQHAPDLPKTVKVQLHDRMDFGQEVQAPVSIIRLRAGRGKLPAHAPGDLLGVLTPGSIVPRFYSLASSHKDGVIEICVRRQNGGQCSSFLTSMQTDETVDVFIKANPAFRPSKSDAPLVLIGAGAGIGPLMGFARANTGKRAAEMFWGGRHPASDFLYETELSQLESSGHLSQVATAFSRIADGTYVQERLRASAEDLRKAIQKGGQIMVCGGAAMGADVRTAWDEILQPIGLSVQDLKSQRRYLEDVY